MPFSIREQITLRPPLLQKKPTLGQVIISPRSRSTCKPERILGKVLFLRKTEMEGIVAQPRGGGRGEAQPLPPHDARPAALTVSIPLTCLLGVETEIYFNDSLKPNCIQAAIQREEPPTCGSTTVRRTLKASPKARGRQTVSFRWGQTAGPGAGSGSVWLHGWDPKNNPEKSLFFSSLASVCLMRWLLPAPHP